MSEINYKKLAKMVADVAKTSARDAEAINRVAETISQHARETARDADQIGARRVDKATVGETKHVSRLMDGLANAALSYAIASENTSRKAQAAHAANHHSHDGIHETAARSPVGTEIYDVERGWLAQE